MTWISKCHEVRLKNISRASARCYPLFVLCAPKNMSHASARHYRTRKMLTHMIYVQLFSERVSRFESRYNGSFRYSTRIFLHAFDVVLLLRLVVKACD